MLRKEVNMDCVTPSHPEAIPHGRNVDMTTCVLTNKTKLSLPASTAQIRGPPTLLPNWNEYPSARNSSSLEAVPILPMPELTAVVKLPVRTHNSRWIPA